MGEKNYEKLHGGNSPEHSPKKSNDNTQAIGSAAIKATQKTQAIGSAAIKGSKQGK